jgi:hypothetical protein
MKYMFNILSHQGNANQNHTKLHLTPLRMAFLKRTITNVSEDVVEEGSFLHCS